MAQNLTYTQCGDCFIPDIRLAHTGIQIQERDIDDIPSTFFVKSIDLGPHIRRDGKKGRMLVKKENCCYNRVKNCVQAVWEEHCAGERL